MDNTVLAIATIVLGLVGGSWSISGVAEDSAFEDNMSLMKDARAVGERSMGDERAVLAELRGYSRIALWTPNSNAC